MSIPLLLSLAIQTNANLLQTLNRQSWIESSLPIIKNLSLDLPKSPIPVIFSILFN
jgi:hypothetical protein